MKGRWIDERTKGKKRNDNEIKRRTEGLKRECNRKKGMTQVYKE